MLKPTRWKVLLLAAYAVFSAAGCGGANSGGTTPPGSSWSVDTTAPIWQIGYGSDGNFPQYAALDTTSGYLRLVPTTQSGFGTSTVIVPSFWTGGVYYQGTPITATYSLSGANLVIDFNGTLGGLTFQGELTIMPPNQQVTAQLNMQSVTGSVVLDNRPGEAFKPVMLSSMHISDTVWDAQSAYVGSQTLTLPSSGWIAQPPNSGKVFGLTGGTSTWKTNAPTMEVAFSSAQTVTGYVTSSTDPNDDNVGFWAATDTVPASYSYTVTAKP